MQIPISPEEQAVIIKLTTGRGRTKWFREGAGISDTPLQKMKELGRAEDEQVEKVRAFLKTKAVKKLIAEHNAAEAIS